MTRLFFHIISSRGNIVDYDGIDVPVVDPAVIAGYVSEVLAEDGSPADCEIDVVDGFGSSLVRVGRARGSKNQPDPATS